eukprot:scaffold109174_cov34-Tisochrysis_lutea.AAC.1
MAALAPLTPLNGSNCNLVDEIDGEANWPGAQGKRPTARAPISPSPSLHPSLPTPPLSLVPTASRWRVLAAARSRSPFLSPPLPPLPLARSERPFPAVALTAPEHSPPHLLSPSFPSLALLSRTVFALWIGLQPLHAATANKALHLNS